MRPLTWWVVAACVLGSSHAVARDLGVQAEVFEIVEPNLIEFLANKASQVDWQRKSDELRESATRKLGQFAFAPLSPAVETRTRYIDPSIELTSPLTAPVDDGQGNMTWQVIYEKGSRVNPLQARRPVTKMLIFDPRQEDQVDFVAAVVKKWPTLIKPLATGGELHTLTRKFDGRTVYLASAPIIDRFDIQHTPSFIGTGRGKHEFHLAVTQIAPADLKADRAVETLTKMWDGLPE
ncbi:hypothetical protein [Sinimarinibacterium sp. NLF-5-8]|uniref:hypothetical protein n=1 Tax=Sinimarinibacterium sp. NLF-5-8 TaxID=2698684 RepID=UPI00137B9F83|nr:hypothetical protein [Sinimarinibacterium sp. NLF-5-8]QHS09079.1 hypothetical protein GT972_02225 [Sinimarinibacterium sp. NLF-5-8]